MKRWQRNTAKEEIAPGDDVCPVPAPVEEEPPFDRFCDLVLTGGVASGVVYPWAIVELARQYRFRNIGGTSVGAMAAALAAAAEYGRRYGATAPFEPLRRLPANLGEELPDGRTRMLSLFQTLPRGRRLITLWGRLGNGNPPGGKASQARRCCVLCAVPRQLASRVRHLIRLDQRPVPDDANAAQAQAAMRGAPACRVICEVASVYASPLWAGALLGALLAVVVCAGAHVLAIALGALLGSVLGLALALRGDIKHGLIANNLGLCAGATVANPACPDCPGLCDWLHEGIQLSAGLKVTDRPLTFRDLWSAPAYPGALPVPRTDRDPPGQRAINLQMITTNVTHGRPYRLPLADVTSRLYFLPDDLRPYLPPSVLDALVAAALPYAPRPNADPPPNEKTNGFRELPGGDLPVLVAARLSLSYPLLFAAVPLYAIDYENPDRTQRRLKRCLFTDGGVSSNFPIHLFDAALPRWPTFGLWLDRQNPYPPPDRQRAKRPIDPQRENRSIAHGESNHSSDPEKAERDRDVWLPEFHRQGWGDNWNRFDPHADANLAERAVTHSIAPAAGSSKPTSAMDDVPLIGFLTALVSSALDWSDRTSFRLPHVRNRVARLLLRPGEGGLHIGMSRRQILDMAHRYGTKAGKLFVERFADQGGKESPAWLEQRWIRFHLLINGLRERLNGLSTSAVYASHCLPMPEAIASATEKAPLREGKDSPKLNEAQARSLEELLGEMERFEGTLRAAVEQDYKPIPEPEFRLRAPL